MLVFIGDVHGEFNELAAKLVRSKVQESSFIQVGDFGLGFKKKEVESNELSVLNSFLEAANNRLYVVRGNHDNPKYFKAPSGFSHIAFLEDYSLLDLEGQIILVAGGAISIDRMVRVLDVSYWAGEEFRYDEELLAKRIKGDSKIDIVVTHNAPEEFWPTEFNRLVLGYALRDRNLLEGLRKERYRHTQLMNSLNRRRLKPKHWYYGHYHTSYDSKYKGIKYRALDCSEMFEHEGQKIILL
jgi:UDP-2,3-diacylglucosamine pyrophosphatase LpxH